MSPEFRLLESSVSAPLKCCECDGHAEGNVNFTDTNGANLGEICDECDARITRDESLALAKKDPLCAFLLDK